MAILSASHLAAPQGAFEPQRTYNWSLEIALDDAGDQVIISQSLESFSAPEESSEEIELHQGNERTYVAGKTLYEAPVLVLKDFVDIGTANAIIKWRQQVKNYTTGSIGLARDYKKNADLELVAPNQTVARFWKLKGIWPQRVKYGELNMADNDFVKIEVTLRYDRAEPGPGLNTQLSGINVGVLTPPII